MTRKTVQPAKNSTKQDKRGSRGACPAGWNLTIEALYDEFFAGKRGQPSERELDQAREYERSLLPADCRFPRRGDVYEATRDQTVRYMTFWALPFTGGGDAVLPKGVRVCITSDPPEQDPLGVYAEPLDYGKIEEKMIPAKDRKDPRYKGFALALDTGDLNRNFKRVGTGATACRVQIPAKARKRSRR